MDTERRHVLVPVACALAAMLVSACGSAPSAPVVDAGNDPGNDLPVAVDRPRVDMAPPGDVASDTAVDADTVTGRPCGSSPACGPTGWCNPATNACQPRTAPREIKFVDDLLPILRAQGCTTCHAPGGVGAVEGTVHVPLILNGSPQSAWSALVAGTTDCSDGLGRRVCVDEPRFSLLARWPLQLPGEPSRIVVAFESWDNPQLQTILAWIAQGARLGDVPPGDGGAPDSAPPPPDARPPSDGAGGTVDRSTPPDLAPEIAPDLPPDLTPDRSAPDASVDLPVPVDGQPDLPPPDVRDTAPDLPDVVPPRMNGTPTATPTTSCQGAVVSWPAASDDRSPAAALRYQVCWATTSTACDTGGGTRISVAAGTTMTTINGLALLTTYFVGVIAIDEANNQATAAITTSFAIPVNPAGVPPPPPTLPVTVTPASATSLNLSWSVAPPGTCLPATHLSYEICVTPMAVPGCDAQAGTWATALTTLPQATSAIVAGLNPATKYAVFVRTTDGMGHTSSSISQTGTTPYSFITNVRPTLSSACSNSSCHMSLSLTAFPPLDYATLTTTAPPPGAGCPLYVNNGNRDPTVSFIYAITQGSTCVHGIMMIDAAGIEAIRLWIASGAPNN